MRYDNAQPLRKKIVALLLAGYAVLAIAVVVIGYLQFREFAIGERVRLARGLTGLVAESIDGDRVSAYIEQGRAAEGYDAVESRLYRLRDAYPDVKFLYVYQVREDGCHVVFDLNTADVAASEPGAVVAFDDSFLKYRDDLLAGGEVPPVVSNDQFGHLLTVYTPVRDSSGSCVCYAAADFSVGLIQRYGLAFMGRVALLFLGVLALVFLVSMRFMDRRFFRPMGNMNRIAYQDALTGVGNKTAYDARAKALNAAINRRRASFAIAVVDVNFLKKVNDTYGHDRGNIYLIASAFEVTRAFGADNVYRTGGDEFAVVLEGEDVSRLDAMLDSFREAIDHRQADESLRPWERVSAAVGASRFDPRQDASADSVLKRADAEMYRNKLAMKAARTD